MQPMEMTMDEAWRDIEGYEGSYQISNTGNVKSLCRCVTYKSGRRIMLRERILKPSERSGYYYVNLNKDGSAKSVFIHRLVALHFLERPRDKDCVNHKDCNTRHNSSENLEWVTKAENNKHAWDNHRQEKLRGIMKRGLRNKAVLQLDLEGNPIKRFDTIKEAGAETGASRAHISSCCKNKYGRKTCGGYRWQYSC